jgi:O-antigen/teichoic acid export membrane protein
MEQLKNFLFENLSTRQTIIKNTLWLYFSEVLARGSRLLVFILIIRTLGPQNFGIFEYLLSFSGFFFLFADFGVSSIFIREYQQKTEKEKHISTFFWIKLLLSIFFFLLAVIGYPMAKKFDGFLFYLLFVLFYFLMNIENFFENFFIAIEKTEKKFVFNTIMSVSLLFFIAFGLLIYPNIGIVILAYVLSALLGIMIAYSLFLKEAQIKKIFDFSLIRYYFVNGFPLVLFGILGYVFFSTDKIILAHLRTVDEVGYYSLASRIIGVLLGVSGLFNVALYPYLSRKVAEKNIVLKKIFSMIIIGSMIVGIILALLVYLSAPLLVPLFFGNDYLSSIAILQVFVWILVLIFPTNFLDYFLISNNKQWLDFFITILPAALNIIFNFILIPKFGVLGAVYGSLLAQLLNFVFTLIASLFILKHFTKDGSTTKNL